MAYEHNGEDGVFTESVLAATAEPDDEPETDTDTEAEVGYEPFDEGEDPLADEAPLDGEDLFADLGDLDLGADDELEPELPPAVVATATVGSDEDLEARIATLEAAARELATAEITREGRRVRRKVSAATTGAGAIGFLPILLQLAGAIDLPPALAATASTVAAIVGAFTAGWATPEREPPLPPTSAHALLEMGR
jgi:hypothetical protein